MLAPDRSQQALYMLRGGEVMTADEGEAMQILAKLTKVPAVQGLVEHVMVTGGHSAVMVVLMVWEQPLPILPGMAAVTVYVTLGQKHGCGGVVTFAVIGETMHEVAKLMKVPAVQVKGAGQTMETGGMHPLGITMMGMPPAFWVSPGEKTSAGVLTKLFFTLSISSEGVPPGNLKANSALKLPHSTSIRNTSTPGTCCCKYVTVSALTSSTKASSCRSSAQFAAGKVTTAFMTVRLLPPPDIHMDMLVAPGPIVVCPSEQGMQSANKPPALKVPLGHRVQGLPPYPGLHAQLYKASGYAMGLLGSL